MWMIKIASILFAAVLLYPVARTFYEMCVFERDAEAEKRPEDWPPPETDDGSSTSFGIMVSQTYYSVAPFERLHRVLGYGPRRWAGIVGLSATVLIMVLLTYSALFPLKGSSHSYEWRDDPDSVSDFDQSAGNMITWGVDDAGAPASDPKPDESGRNGD